MAPPHKRLRITNSSTGTPLRSNHLRRRRSVPITRCRRQTDPPIADKHSGLPPRHPPAVGVEANNNNPTVAVERSNSPTGAVVVHACDRKQTESPVETESNNLNNTEPQSCAQHSHHCVMTETSPPSVNGSNECDATAQILEATYGVQNDHGLGIGTMHAETEAVPADEVDGIRENEVPTGAYNDEIGLTANDDDTASNVRIQEVGSTHYTSDDGDQNEVADNGENSPDRPERNPDEDVISRPHSLFLHRIHRMVTWNRLVACIALSGRTGMTAEQYEFFRIALQTVNTRASLATYKTARTSHWKEFVDTAFPKSTVMNLRTISRHRPTGPAIMAADKNMHDPSDCVKVVLPSEWAKLDVLSFPFYNDVFERTERNVFDIEWAPIVRNRSMVTGAEVTLWCTYENAVCASKRGDKLRFLCDEITGDMEEGTISRTASRPNSDTVLKNKSLHVEGTLASIWLVDSTACAPQSSTSRGFQDFTASEHSVYATLRDMTPTQITAKMRSSSRSDKNNSKHLRKVQTTISRSITPRVLFMYPGDYCAIVRPDTQLKKGHVCLFVASPTGSVTGETMERLVWVSVKRHGTPNNYVCVEAEAVVRDLPAWVGGPRHLPTFPTGFSPNQGKLEEGTNFVVYRLALYTDGFKQHKSLADSRSVDGCYMLPLGNSLQGRTSSTSSRVISLTPHGHSANEVLHLIEKDLLNGSTIGIKSFDPFGRPVRIFLDVVSMFGDYPALSATADLRGHNATAFCTFCTFRELPTSKSGSRLHSTLVHSRRPSATRTDTRRILIRPNLHENGLKLLGFKKESMAETDNLPMVRLARSLRNPRTIPKDDHGRKFMPTGFDSVQSMAAAPDHLICGLIENTLRLCFANLTSNEERRSIELRMITDARDTGLTEQGMFLKWEGNSFKGIRSVTMSTKICMLLTSVRPFNEVHGNTRRAEFLLPQQLQMFVSYVYYVPNADVEGHPAAHLQTAHGYLKLRGNQVRLAREFLETSTEVYKRNPELGGLLNIPNAHRALELCVHTITNFAHARNCSEMVLEMAHRKFKSWLECNTHSDSHISSMERAVSADWQGRVAMSYDLLCTGSLIEQESASRCLRRLLLGEDVLHMDGHCTEGRSVIDTFNEAIAAAMADPVRREMDLGNQVNCVQGRKFRWEIDRSREQVQVDQTLERGRQILEHWLLEAHPETSIAITQCKKASYVSTCPSRTRRRTYPHLTVKAGNAVSIVTIGSPRNRTVVLEEPNTDSGEMQFFAIYGIFGTSDGDVWCVVRRLSETGLVFSVQSNPVCVLKMGRRVRRVAVIHACDKMCSVDLDKKEVHHGMRMCDGGTVELVPRFDGYPPHLG